MPKHRGHLVFLDSGFFAGRALSPLLDALAQHFAFPEVQSDARPDEITLYARTESRIRPLRLFHSDVRTGMLVALEVLGGSASTGLLAKAVEGEFASSVKNAIAFFVRIGVLKKRKALVTFADTAWLPELRTLLKAYAREYPQRVKYAKDARRSLERWKNRRPSPGPKKGVPWPLMQSDPTLPMLAVLLDGPQAKVVFWRRRVQYRN